MISRCEFELTIKKTQKYKLFLNDFEKLEPLQRLQPYDAVHGAINEALVLSWNKADHPEQTLSHLDACSAYANAGLRMMFPTHDYEIWVDKQIKSKVVMDPLTKTVQLPFRDIETNQELYGVAIGKYC